MKIAIIGYGKMGKEIEKIALERKHQIGLIIDQQNYDDDFTAENLKKCQVAIEFSQPESATRNFRKCFEAGVPVVSGTTGWLEKWGEIEDLRQKHNAGFLYASNFSLGVNLFFELNRQLAKLMNGFENYDVEIQETHHTEKLDAPSGTAISLALDILERVERKTDWTLERRPDKEQVAISAARRGKVFGIHTVTYDSPQDFISITHSAKSRQGFALGAVLAAEFLAGKTGSFSMKDLLKIG